MPCAVIAKARDRMDMRRARLNKSGVMRGLVHCPLSRDKPHMGPFKHVSRMMLDFALPPRCPACGEIVQQADSFCLPCWSSLSFLDGGGCVSCAMPMEQEGMVCGSCLANPPAHDGVRAAIAYNKVAGEVVMRFKYGRRPGLARVLAAGMARHSGEVDFSDAVLVPVPLHRLRLWQRGFNQSAMIARLLSKRLGMALCVDGLIRHRNTPPLRGLNPRQREATVRTAFAINPKQADKIKGKNIVLVDDVYTTGSTTNACARILKRTGAKRVQLLCWARALPEWADVGQTDMMQWQPEGEVNAKD
jgi:ComF family protein